MWSSISFKLSWNYNSFMKLLATHKIIKVKKKNIRNSNHFHVR